MRSRQVFSVVLALSVICSPLGAADTVRDLDVLLKGIKVGDAMQMRNLCLVPLIRGEPLRLPFQYMLAAEAIEKGLLQITEVTRGGSVPELRVVSKAGVPILLLGGEELLGAKQNRMLNTDVLLRPNAEAVIPVSCVEQGRWRAVTKEFAAGNYAPAVVRADANQAVTANLRVTGKAEADQAQVWENVSVLARELDASSDTAAMADAFKCRKKDLDSMVAALPCPDNACGVIVLIDGRFVALDLFDRSATLRQLWSRLVTSYAADALARRTADGSTENQTDASALLNQLRQAKCEVRNGVDLGEDWRLDSPAFAGSALVYKGIGVHLSVFGRNAPVIKVGEIAVPSRRGD